MNFKEEKIDTELESAMFVAAKTARVAIKPNAESLQSVLENFDVAKFEQKPKVVKSEKSPFWFFVSFSAVALLLFVTLNINFTGNDFKYQVSSLEAEAEVMDANLNQDIDDSAMQTELDMEMSSLESEIGDRGL